MMIRFTSVCVALSLSIHATGLTGDDVTFLATAPNMSASLPRIDATAAPGADPGYRITTILSSDPSPGMTRIECRFESRTGPSSMDRTWRIRLVPLPGGHVPLDASCEVAFDFLVPQGSRQHQVARHLPKTSYGNLFEVSIAPDGRRPTIEGVSFDAILGNTLRDANATLGQLSDDETVGRVLWIDDRRDESTRSDSLQSWHYPGLRLATGRMQDLDNHLATREVAELPTDWRAYQEWDNVVIHHQRWAQWQKSPNAKGDALRAWLAGGGTLIVRGYMDDDEDPQRARSNSERFSDTFLANARSAVENSTSEMMRQFLRMQFNDGRQTEAESVRLDELSVRELIDMVISQSLVTSPNQSLEAGLVVAKVANALIQMSPSKWFGKDGVTIQDMGAGTIIHLPPRPDDMPLQITDWLCIAELLSWRQSRLLRSGVDPMLGSQRFSEWLIPGVAEPPVYTFMGLLSLFVVLVGPIAYRKTTRTGRGYLMFLIAPVLALLTTISMLLYGILSDGFGTQTRVRQITWVDSQTGDGFTRTRATYFAGIRPSNGLAFPPNADVTVFPDNQQASWEDRLEGRFESRGQVSINDESIRFSGLFLPSRQQRQFVVQQPRPDWGQIWITPDSALFAQVKQTSDHRLRDFLARDDNGIYYSVAEVPAKGEARAKRLPAQEASKQMGALYRRQWLVSTVTNGTSSRRSYAYAPRTYDVLSRLHQAYESTLKPTEGIFETELQARLQLGSGLPMGSFVAVADLTDDALGIDDAVARESIHFVMGDLR